MSKINNNKEDLVDKEDFVTDKIVIETEGTFLNDIFKARFEIFLNKSISIFSDEYKSKEKELRCLLMKIS